MLISKICHTKTKNVEKHTLLQCIHCFKEEKYNFFNITHLIRNWSNICFLNKIVKKKLIHFCLSYRFLILRKHKSYTKHLACHSKKFSIFLTNNFFLFISFIFITKFHQLRFSSRVKLYNPLTLLWFFSYYQKLKERYGYFL